MTAVESAGTATDATRAQARTCPRCGAPLTADQDWCLECGAAVSTRVERPPDWRLPAAIVAAVLALAGGSLAVAFVGLAGDGERVVEVPQPAPTATASPDAGTTPSPAPSPADEDSADPGAPGTGTAEGAGDATDDDAAAQGGGSEVASWPEGRTAWTVILHSAETRADAEARARELQAAGTPVGVLRSDDYATLRPGYWVVFSGEYETQEAAQEAAEGLSASAADAYPRLVEPR